MAESSMVATSMDRIVWSQAWLNTIRSQRLERKHLRPKPFYPLTPASPLNPVSWVPLDSIEAMQPHPVNLQISEFDLVNEFVLWDAHQGLEDIKQEIKQINMLLAFQIQDLQAQPMWEMHLLFERILRQLCECLRDLAIDLLRFVDHLAAQASSHPTPCSL
ncbi:hypothetical protein H6G21_04370 [Alkalinema sp. FACHB-956]|nr:hypothetical protein [Alkalinema sp. FACHB-956]